MNKKGCLALSKTGGVKIVETRESKRVFWGILFIWLILMAIFTFADLNLSKSIYNPVNSMFGKFFDVFGEHPALIILFISGSILFKTSQNDKIVKKVIVRLVSILFIFMGGFTVFLFIFHRGMGIINTNLVLLSIAFVVLLAVLVQLFLNRIPLETLKLYNTAAWAGIVIIFAEMMIVNVLKIFWGRLRFREMGDDYSQFTTWFLPNGIQENGIKGEAYKSFPSGHSANGWAIMVGMLFMPYKKIWRNSMLVIAIIWGVCTSVSRVIMGAHFATDVLFGAMITISCLFLVSKLFNIELYPKNLS